MRNWLLAALALTALGALWMALDSPGVPGAVALAQESSEGDCSVSGRLLLQLGVGDRQPTEWNGSATGWLAGESATWEAQSQSSPLKLAGGGQSARVLPAEVVLDLPSAGCEGGDPSRIQIQTPHGEFQIDPSSMTLGRAERFLSGRVSAARVPAATQLTDSALEEDYPDCTALADGSTLCAFVEFAAGRPVNVDAALAGEFGSLEFEGHGDRLVLLRQTQGGWAYPVFATHRGRDLWRPVVTSLSDGDVAAVLWSEQRGGNWDLYLREYRVASGVLGPERRLTRGTGPDFNVVAAGDFLAWQSRTADGFDIYAGRIGSRPLKVSTSAANDWRPAIALDSSGAAWIAWDTYDAGNYDVYLRRLDGNGLGEPIAVATSPRFEARPSLAVDNQDRVWIAFEDSDEEWGKDAGDRWTGRQATPMYVNKNILVRVWDGTLKETVTAISTPPVDSHHDDPRIATSLRQRISIPRVAIGGNGTPWLLFRRHPLQTGRGERWRSYASYYSGDTWSDPIPLRESDHLLDRQPGLVARQDGGLLAVVAGDRRTRAADRKDSNLYAAVLDAGSNRSPPALGPADASAPRSSVETVHPDEAEQVSRMRARRVEVGGRSLRFLRGEFHRHSEFSAHRDWDGPFEEVWRYGLDVADMDWIGAGDHDYAVSQDYLWWLQQKTVDLYHEPGAFSAMYTYERNVNYPSGHRNVMLPRRGIRPAPRMRGRERMFGTEEGGSADIRNLYAYLEYFEGICSSHTSATNMGTDWRDSNISVEPVVEIFQGHRQSYEVAGGPTAATGPEDTIQGYRPAGFVWEAFQKGRRLGFQASSDHVSTHISYAIVLAEDNSREAIMDAFRKRHSYAAHDNIALVVRSGDHLMGDEFTSFARPRLEISVSGTAPVDSLEIIRQVGRQKPEIVASMEPRSLEVDLRWSDAAAVAGEWNMYYVRLKQRNEAMAWASPLWIHYDP